MWAKVACYGQHGRCCATGHEIDFGFIGTDQVPNYFPRVCGILVGSLPTFLGACGSGQCREDTGVCTFTLIVVKTGFGCCLCAGLTAEAQGVSYSP